MQIKIKKGDTVRVLAGKDRGKSGSVERVIVKDRALIVAGVNTVKKHTRPRRNAPHGGIITKPNPMPVGKVMLICPRCQKPTRVMVQIDAEGNRHRACRNCHEMIDVKG